MQKITRYGVGTAMIGASSVLIGLFAPETGWIRPETAKYFTILGFIMLAIGGALLAKVFWSNRSKESLEQKFNRLLDGLETQSDGTNRSIDEAIGITETAAGKPALLVPIDEPANLGDICRGSKQTFSGLDADGSFFFKIPELGLLLLLSHIARLSIAL